MPDSGLCPECGTEIGTQPWASCPECGADFDEGDEFDDEDDDGESERDDF